MKLWQKFAVPALFVGVIAVGAPERVMAQAASIKIDGSSTVFPISEALAEEFQISKRGKVHVTVGIAGSGGGFKKFCRGETDIANASRPILAEEMEACRKAGITYMELPIAFDALTVVVNPANTWVKSMTVAELKKIWEPGAQGRINNWNQVRSGFPSEKLSLFGPGTDSGTFDYFTEAVNGKSKASRADYTASEDDNTLVQGVENSKGGLGYFGFAYYAAHKDKLRAVPIDGGKGPVEPSAENVVNGTYQPLSRPLFMYVKVSAAARPEVQEFITFCLTKGAEYVSEVGYVPLPASAYKTVLQHFNERKVGTVFGGVPKVGLTIDQLLTMERKE
jgi:phosphate transport system substrate-binding protein